MLDNTLDKVEREQAAFDCQDIFYWAMHLIQADPTIAPLSHNSSNASLISIQHKQVDVTFWLPLMPIECHNIEQCSNGQLQGRFQIISIDA